MYINEFIYYLQLDLPPTLPWSLAPAPAPAPAPASAAATTS